MAQNSLKILTDPPFDGAAGFGGSLATIVDHFEPFWAYFEPFWAYFGSFWAILSHFEPFWAILGHFEPF